jgi:hypothetical protein
MKKSDIGNAASELTRSQFAQELSRFLRLSTSEIDALFPTEADREELARLTNIVLNAGTVNRQRAALIDAIPGVAGAVLKLLRHAAIPA